MVKVDRMTMAHGLEARPPFLDHVLVEATLALPIERRWRPGSRQGPAPRLRRVQSCRRRRARGRSRRSRRPRTPGSADPLRPPTPRRPRTLSTGASTARAPLHCSITAWRRPGRGPVGLGHVRARAVADRPPAHRRAAPCRLRPAQPRTNVRSSCSCIPRTSCLEPIARYVRWCSPTSDLVRPIVVLPNDLPYDGALSSSLRAAGIEVIVGRLPVVRRRYLGPRLVSALGSSIIHRHGVVDHAGSASACGRRHVEHHRRWPSGRSSLGSWEAEPFGTSGRSSSHLAGIDRLFDTQRALPKGRSWLSRRPLSNWLGDIRITVRSCCITVSMCSETRCRSRSNRARSSSVDSTAGRGRRSSRRRPLPVPRVPTATFALVGGAVPDDHETAFCG